MRLFAYADILIGQDTRLSVVSPSLSPQDRIVFARDPQRPRRPLAAFAG